MRNITRRLTAAVLSACLALSSAGAFAQMQTTAQIELPASDGTSMLLPVESVITSTGETVYWLDISMLSDEQIEALAMAQMMLYDETGEILGQYLFSELDEGVIKLFDALDPEITVPMMISPVALPEDPEEVEAVLAEYGFESSSFENEYANEFAAEYVDEFVDEYVDDEAERIAEEEAARIEAERIAAEEAARVEAERIAAEEAARIEAERIAEEEAARVEAERIAAEEAARVEAERIAAEEAARVEAERIAEEEAARVEAERIAAEEAARVEAERIAEEEAARIEAERIAEEEAARLEAEQAIQTPNFEEIIADIVVPEYVFPENNSTNLRSEPLMNADNVLIQVNVNDVLTVSGHAVDNEGNIWWQATDYRTGIFGFIMADYVNPIDEQEYQLIIDMIEAERLAEEEAALLAAEEAARLEEERLAAEEAARLDAERFAAEEAARLEADRLEAEENAKLEQELLSAVEGSDEEDDLSEDEETVVIPDFDQIEIEQIVLPDVDQDETDEAVIPDFEQFDDEESDDDEAEQEAQPAVRYAVTSNRNNPTNNLRAKADSKADVVGVYENGELLIWDEPTSDGKWYPVTVVRDGAQGYMRDYLLTEISEADAQIRMAEILADMNGEIPEYIQDSIQDEPDDESTDALVQEFPDVIVQEDEESVEETEDENGDASIIPEESDEESIQIQETPSTIISSFPAYAMTLMQENNVAIVLREEPAGDLPQSGAVPMITAPTPLEITGEKLDGEGNVWLLVRNMNNGDTGYIELHKVELVDQETAEANVVPEIEVLPPVPSENENTQPEDDNPPSEDEQPEENEDIPEEIEPVEPEIPDTPQELTDGDIYHYGRNTGKQVALRAEPHSNGKLHYRMEAGTVLWVMSKDGDWCHVRTDRGEGYVMSKFVKLMDVREESDYIATLDDPEIAPERTEAPSTQPEIIDPNYPELIVPEKTESPTATPEPNNAKPTPTPAPQEIERYGVVIADNTQLRSNPTMDSYLQAEIAENGVVYAMRSEMNDDGEMWTLVQADGQWGYVLSDHIRLMDDEEQENYLAEQEAAKVTPTPTIEPTATPEPTKTPAPQRLDFYARVINDGTPLRGNPDPNAYLQNILDAETVVFLFQSQIAADGMTWYLVQHSGQWGYIRADLVRPMGEQETADYLAQLEAELATPTPMPLITPEPIGPDSTSAYAKLIKDKVNLRRTPSSSGTSLDRVPINTLLLVLGSEKDGTNTWYQVSYNGHEGYIRSDMAKMLTIAELEAHFQEQMEQAQNTKPNASVTPNKNNNTDIVINGSQLQDLIPVDNSWTNNVIQGMPLYGTATPDPNATPTPQPPEKSAALIRSSGNITVSNVPALTREASFAVYGKTKAYTTVTATVEMPSAAGNALPASIGMNLVSTAIAENTVKRTVGQAISKANGVFEMNVTLPQEGEYIVEFAAADGAYAQYGVTYDTGATPMPTPMPLPTAAPIEEEDGGLSIWPFVIGGLLVVIAAGVYGVYVYRRRSEEDEDEEDEDDETELRQAQLNMQRQRAASSAQPKAPTSTVIPGTQRMPKAPSSSGAQTPSYMKTAQQSPYARPQAPTAPQAPEMPKAPVAPQMPVAPKAPQAPRTPAAPQAPVMPKAPEMPKAPIAEQSFEDDAASVSSTPRRRRRPPVDPNA